MTLYEIIIFLAWTIGTCAMAFYAGYAKKGREVIAEEIIKTLKGG